MSVSREFPAAVDPEIVEALEIALEFAALVAAKSIAQNDAQMAQTATMTGLILTVALKRVRGQD